MRCDSERGRVLARSQLGQRWRELDRVYENGSLTASVAEPPEALVDLERQWLRDPGFATLGGNFPEPCARDRTSPSGSATWIG